MSDHATQTVSQALALAVVALENCREHDNAEGEARWEQRIVDIMQAAPSGGGIDSGTQFLESESMALKLLFRVWFHHVDENGYYDGWTEHRVTVRPTFNGIDIKVSGRNRYDIKEYLTEVFEHWLTSQAPAPTL